ncbi:hypothetical protein H8356DRAFT_1349289 [Neocallimastix lanati (nom. inval.)]|nr:hypothetical protein H8356DRAFT_1342248 [Neocallimastix sp. JGI-2020a]KAG4085637.1 hypothetical protein H8356DRAFT_1364405 [Neocallimastix sp. JGI-2020a]KAG4098061.1 hypothetical protein H8356DRAFT_1349289 [Neocallimastix sp. JGI-2020a]
MINTDSIDNTNTEIITRNNGRGVIIEEWEKGVLDLLDPQYWCKIVVKLYFVLINNIMRNGNVIGKIFLLHPRISNTFSFAKSNYFSIIQQTTNYRNYLLQKDIKLLQFSLYSRLYNKN